MGTRPKEIQQLVDWLREPGRELSAGWTDHKGRVCVLNELHSICGGGEVGHRRCARVLDPETQSSRRAVDLATINDTTRDPLAVAEYLEREFPA